jgi:hypothetical protein
MTKGGLKLSLILLSFFGSAPPTWTQIQVPDRLTNGKRMPALTTPSDWGKLPFDTLRTLPSNPEGTGTWWHRHALFTDGPIQLTLDPVVDVTLDRRRSLSEQGATAWEKGHRNVRGVRYAGQIDKRIQFGGKVLEMQRLLVGPETDHVLAAQEYPGMGTGKLRPTENGLYSIDHSLAEVWFNAQASERVQLEWGIGATGMGPGVRNLLWSDARAPAPFLLIEVNLGKGWTYRWVQSRQRSRARMPANGAREGRYAPLGLSIRSLGKTIPFAGHRLDLHFMVARWTDVLNRESALDWALAMAPWAWPNATGRTTPWYAAGHQGLDMQWRRKKSTWYGQVRIRPIGDDRYASLESTSDFQPVQALVGHVRHGEQLSLWTEWAPTAASAPEAIHPDLPVSALGIQPWSPIRNSWIQGIEYRTAGLTFAAEGGLTVSKNISWKATLRIPSAAADPSCSTRSLRKSSFPNRLWPALVPLTPLVAIMGISGTEQFWWSIGVSSPVIRARKTH